MTPAQADLLWQASDSVGAARSLLDQGYAGYAASRAYYAMFYIAEAFLEGEGLSFSKHSAVISAFGERFAKTERIRPEFHRFLIEGQAVRNTGDYGIRGGVDKADAALQIDRATRFLAKAIELLGPLPQEPPEG